MEVITTPSGKTILDFGQNLVGRLRLTVTGAAGNVITLRHARCSSDGELARAAAHRERDRHVHAPRRRAETWAPRFTFHGFRYAEVDGWPGELDPPRLAAVVCTPTWSAPAGSRHPTRWSTGCTRTSSGGCAATSSTCPPTARSATSASAGPAT